MKKKIRALVPTFILEILEKDCEFFGITKEKLCNEIFLKFSLKFRSRYQDEMIFEEKVIFLHSAMKEYRVLKIDTPIGIEEGRVSKIYRCKETGYFKLGINENNYYISQIRVIS